MNTSGDDSVEHLEHSHLSPSRACAIATVSLTVNLGRGQESSPAVHAQGVAANGSGDSDMVPVVEWRPVVVGYRSLKDGSVSRENAEQLMKHSLFNPMAFPSQQ